MQGIVLSWSIAKPCMPSILFLYDRFSLPDAQLMHGWMSCNVMVWLVCVTYSWEGRVLWDYMEIAAPEDGKYTKSEAIGHCLLADRIIRVL